MARDGDSDGDSDGDGVGVGDGDGDSDNDSDNDGNEFGNDPQLSLLPFLVGFARGSTTCCLSFEDRDLSDSCRWLDS